MKAHFNIWTGEAEPVVDKRYKETGNLRTVKKRTLTSLIRFVEIDEERDLSLAMKRRTAGARLTLC